MRTARTKKRLKRKGPFIICCLVLLALLAGGGAMAWNFLFPLPQGTSIEEIASNDDGKRLNVLLLGIDPRDGESMSRTDTIIVASVDTKTKQMALLSIPRDTRVNIPGHGWDKINSASVYGGPELTMRVVSDLLGTPMRYYVLANFNGFKNIVDALGGVTLDVDQNMYHEDEPAYAINLRKGVQRLDGEKAIQYVRYRGYVTGDIERTEHQQKFLMALGREMLQPGTILKLPVLIPQINRYVKTNLTPDNMYQLAAAAKKLEGANMVAQTLPGVPVTIGDGSYWGVDPSEAKRVLTKLYNGEVLEVAQNSSLTPQMLGISKLPTAEPDLPPAEDKAEPSSGKAQENPAIPGAKAGGKTATGTGGKLPPGSVVIKPGGSGDGINTGNGTGTPDKTGSGTGTTDPDTTGSGTGGSSASGGATPGGTSGSTTGKEGTTTTPPGSSGTSLVDPVIPSGKNSTVL